VAATQSSDSRPAGKSKWATGAPEVLALLLLIHSALFAWQYATRTPMVDFFVFWSVPHSLSIKPATNIYTEEGRREMGTEMATEAEKPTASETQRQATYANMQDPLHNGKVDSHGSPFLYTLMGLLSSGDYDGDQKRFAIVSLLCLAASVAMLGYLLRLSTAAILLLMAFLASDFAPVVSDIGVGNLNEIQLFAVALFILLAGRSRHLLAGIAIGTATMLKPTTAVVLALAVIIAFADRDFRRMLRLMLGACAAAAGAFGLSALYFSNPGMWVSFAKSLSGTMGEGAWPLEKGNYGLAKLLFGGTGPGPTVILVVLLAVFCWVVFSTRRKAGAAEPAVANAFAAAGVGCALMLLSSPLAWVHYYVLLIPLSLYVIQPAAGGEPWALDGVVAKSLAFAPLLALSVWTQYNLGSSPVALATAFNCAAVATLGLALLRIRRQRGQAPATPVAVGAKPLKPARS
jgi:hypothetical protein